MLSPADDSAVITEATYRLSTIHSALIEAKWILGSYRAPPGMTNTGGASELE
jgi:hypothetical protein